MAWQMKVLQIFAPDPSQVIVNVSYYDDAITDPNPPNNPVVQFTKQLSFPINTPAAKMQAVGIAVGQDARTAYLRTQTLLAAAPVGTVIAIP